MQIAANGMPGSPRSRGEPLWVLVCAARLDWRAPVACLGVSRRPKFNDPFNFKASSLA